MLSQLPEQADPRRLCEQGKSFAGSVALRDLPRLTPLLTSTEGEAAFTLEFGKDEESRLRVRGEVTAELPLQCERCTQDMVLSVRTAFCLSPVSGPVEAESLPVDYDPLMLEDALLHPMDLVEDELILAIPPAPRHPEAECAVKLTDYQREPETEAPKAAEANPFAVLAELKSDNNETDT
jgi:uncharacterized protein